MPFETLELTPEPGARVVADHLDGSGPPLVFLHGLTSVRVGEKSTILFEYAARRGLPAWRFDFRGHGDSSGTLADTTLTDLILDTRTVLERAGPSFLIGSSLGGLVAAWTAKQAPGSVRGMALLAPAFRFLPRLRARLDAARRLVLPHGEGILEFSTRVLEDFERHDEAAMAAAIRQPTLVVHGALDDTVPVEASEEFVARLPAERKELVVLPEGDHRLNREFAVILERAAGFLGFASGGRPPSGGGNSPS